MPQAREVVFPPRPAFAVQSPALSKPLSMRRTAVSIAKNPDWRPLLAYATNVHRGETLADVYGFLEKFTVPVKELVFGRRTGGVELRLGIGAARELRKPAARKAFKAFLAEKRLVVFSINAFPLLDFHAKRVKEQVYLPSWAERQRVEWTNVIAEIFADLLPEGLDGSISTLAGGFRPSTTDESSLRKIAANYVATVEELARIEAKTGKTIVLAVEPEPDTTFETARELVSFFEWHMIPAARSAWMADGLTSSDCEARLRKFFTVNYDTCHFSVLFQDPVDSLRQFWRAGIEVGKMHVTSALALKGPERSPEKYVELRRMDEPRYFHQFCGRSAEGKVVWRGLDLPDLPAKLTAKNHPRVEEIRSHYHVPIHLLRWQRLSTTRDETKKAVLEVLRARRCSHLVIETYTWPLFDKEENLVQGIANEFEWLRGVMGERWPASLRV